MSLYEKLKLQLPEFSIEVVTTDNMENYENIFYSNQEYFLITDGHPANKQNIVDTIEYGNDFPHGMCHCLGFSLNGVAVAFLSFFEGYPEADTLYIGLFLMDSKFKRMSIGTKIISTLIEKAFRSQYTSVKLSVQDNNISGYLFWKKLGFSLKEKTICNGFYNLSMELKRGI